MPVAIGLARALDYVTSLGREKILRTGKGAAYLCYGRLSAIKGVKNIWHICS